MSNINQIPMTKIQKFKQCLVLEGFGHAQRRRLRRVLNIVICCLFVIWCLGFVILDTKLRDGAMQPLPMQVFKINQINQSI